MRQKDEKRQKDKEETEWHKDKIRGKTEYIKKIQSEIRKVRLEKWKTGYKQRCVTNKFKKNR